MIVDEEAYLEHYGVKGMKWGVRRQRSLDRVKRVAEGKGSLSDKAHTLGRVNLLDLGRGRGSLKKSAASKAERLEARKKRIQEGRATALDFLAQAGTLRISDLGPLDR